MAAPLLALLLTAACGTVSSPPPRPTGANLLLITLDTTRADHLGCYGYGEGRTPALDSIAASGVLFENAYTTAVVTLPAHVGILTGLFPPAHGVRHNGIDRLRPEVTTLAELLGAAGYRTGAFVSAEVLESGFGLDKGFEDYDDTLPELDGPGSDLQAVPERDADTVTDAALAWLARDDGRPWFLWVHYFDPHYPYAPGEPYRTEFAGRPYDGEIAAMDAAIARLLAGRDRASPGKGGAGGSVVTIVVGDHGEGLGDHGEATHGVFVHEESARVPLLMAAPGLVDAGGRFGEIVRSIDVAPTALDLLGLAPFQRADGVSLRPLVDGDNLDEPLRAYTEAVLPATMFGWDPSVALREGRWTYIHAQLPELYDVERDPRERENLVASSRAEATRLRNDLADLLGGLGGERPGPAGVLLDADQVERLRSLGYVAGGDPSFREQIAEDPLAIMRTDAGNSPDARARVRLMESMDRIRGELEENHLEEVVTMATALLEESPGNSFVRTLLAEAAERRGDLELALEQYRAILTSQRFNLDAWIREGRILTRMDDLAGAKLSYTHALAIHPRHFGALTAVAGLAMIEGDLALAEESYRKAIGLRPGHVAVTLTLAKLAEKRGDVDAARALLEKVVDVDASQLDAQLMLSFLESRAGHYDRALEILDVAATLHPHKAEISVARGQIYFEQGLLDKAEGELKTAITRAPQLPQGYHGLGLIAAHRGEVSQARRWFEMALDADPQFSRSRDALDDLKKRSASGA
jgi:arylsulfatase A-like enzyme/tetratricopeptide (TPR) repeat protein